MPGECFQEVVVNDLEKLFEDDEEYDVIIYVGEDENVKEIYAHSIILRARSQYFRTAFSKKWSKKKNGKFIFNKPNISPELFKIILRFIYCGRIDLEKLQGHDILKLLMSVDELDIQTLTHYIQEYLIKHQDELLQQDPIGILELVYQNDTFTHLWDSCLETICKEPKLLINSDKFISIKPYLLESLFKRDDFPLDEIVIWDSLIKWCLAQHSNISHDPTNWNDEEIKIMERTIHRFISLIRFNYISSEDFITKIYPFLGIMPKDIVYNTLMYHMVPNKQLIVDERPLRQSILIKSEHFAILSSLIEKKNYSYYHIRNIPYKFNLLYRASRDGNTAAAFHRKCDDKGATIVVIKVADSNQVVGGYNPLYWYSNNTFKSTYDSCIFSFTDVDDIQSLKVGYSDCDKYSIGCYLSNGPIFGSGHDLYFYNGFWHTYPSSYPKIDIPASFVADDYEVFQVVKK